MGNREVHSIAVLILTCALTFFSFAYRLKGTRSFHYSFIFSSSSGLSTCLGYIRLVFSFSNKCYYMDYAQLSYKRVYCTIISISNLCHCCKLNVSNIQIHRYNLLQEYRLVSSLSRSKPIPLFGSVVIFTNRAIW